MEPMLEDAHTRLRVGGGLEVVSPGGRAAEPVPSASPVGDGPRYTLSLASQGKLERLAKARFELGEMVGFDPAQISREDKDTLRSIALTVYASSEIESEGVGARLVEPYLAAVTEAGPVINEELAERLPAHQDVIGAYFWALAQKPEPVISSQFILETHRRMFEGTKGEIAGRWKTHEVVIRYVREGTERVLPTVPANRAGAFIDALCDRANHAFKLARTYSESSMFLAAAEFSCDFLAIHPFEDGNGRAARLLSTYLLERGGYHFSRIYPLDQVVLDTRDWYYDALFKSQAHWHTSNEDLTAWVDYFVGAVFEQWQRAFSRIRNNRSQPASDSP